MRPAIHIRDLHKQYTVVHDRPVSVKDAMLQRVRGHVTRREQYWALQGVSLDVNCGEAVGVIGSNGSGKSTLLGVVGRVLRPTSGVVERRGRISILMEAGVGFHEDLTGLENIVLSGVLLGMPRREVLRKVDQIIEFAGINQFIDTPVRMLSSGMYMRLGFSVAIHLDPQILLVDEVLAVGDESFHHKCRSWLGDFRDRGGAIMFVSHRMAEVKWLCDRVVWLQNGVVHAEGPTDEIVDAYVEAHGLETEPIECLLPDACPPDEPPAQ